MRPDALCTVGVSPRARRVSKGHKLHSKIQGQPMNTQPDAGWISSSEFSTATYPPHGEFRLRMEGNLALYEAVGPFNLQAIQALARVRDALMGTLQSDDMVAAVVHFHQSAIMTPDAFTAWGAGLQQLAAKRKAIAGVCWVAQADVEGFHFLLSHYRAIFEQAQIPFHACTDLALALGWAREQLNRPQGPACVGAG